MNMYTGTRQPPPASLQAPTRRDKTLAVFFGGLILAAAFIILLSLVLMLITTGRLMPGTTINGIDIGGLNRQGAASLLQQQITYPQTGLVALEYAGQVWTFTPAELGLTLDARASVEAAYRHGRTGWPWQMLTERIRILQHGQSLSPVMVFDERQARQELAVIAAAHNQEMQEAELRLENLKVTAVPGQVGRMIDVEAALDELRARMLSLFNASITLQAREYHPAIVDASAQAETATEMLKQPLILQVSPDPNEKLGPWEIAPETLAGMLVIERHTDPGGDRFTVRLDRNTLFNILYPLTPSLHIDPENARFIFNDETRALEVIRPATIGRELLVEESIDHINAELAKGNHTIDLVFDRTNPEVTDNAIAADLGITELIIAESTFFYGSDEGRIQNIVTAAGQFHGILIPPGATFSMVENIGDISLDSGYAEAWIIYGDRTIKGVGGGVCQVSTTLFRTVFFGGYPVVERWPHAYRVSYYELVQSSARDERLAGLDATVYAPVVDFKFTNDTEHWLLLETYVNVGARSLTWKFYSTDDGRQVEWTTTGLTDVVKPPFPVYEENDKLDKGEIKKVDWAVEGATVTIERTVTRGGTVLYQDTFRTKYEPWAAVCQYGPGTKDYPPEDDQRDRFTCQVKD